jgi:hypothetical protein
MSTFSDFLSRNNITLGGVLPLVHSTRAYHLKGIVGSNKIIAAPCDVFRPETLSYFFVGRPAYKYRDAPKPSIGICHVVSFLILHQFVIYGAFFRLIVAHSIAIAIQVTSII